MTKKETNILREYDFSPCPTHGYTDVVYDHDTGEAACGGCGLVLQEQMMDKGPEWRAFTLEEEASRSRVGIPTSYSVHDKGLPTKISRSPHDALGRRIKPPKDDPGQMYRLRKWQVRTRVLSSMERNLAYAMAQLNRICNDLYIPKNVKEQAAIKYRKALEKGMTRGRSIMGMVGATLFWSCRESKMTRTLREIAESCSLEKKVEKKNVYRCYRYLLEEFTPDKPMPVQDPVHYISKIAEEIGASGTSQGIATRIIKLAKNRRIAAGKGPMGLAAAALYIGDLIECDVKKASGNWDWDGNRKRQREIAEAAEITEVTVRNRYKTFMENIKPSELAHILSNLESLMEYGLNEIQLKEVIEKLYRSKLIPFN